MGELTIDQLAERTGLSVRNIRAYQAKHLLHSPVLHGRAAFYDESHVERIELIRRLQDEGFNLDAARMLIEQGEAFNSELARLRDELAPSGARNVVWVPMSEAGLELVRENSPDALDRLVDAEILRRDDDGQIWVRPEFRIGWRLIELGLPASSLYALLFAVDRHAKPLGRVYADQVQEHLLEGSRDRLAADEVTDLARVREQYEEMTAVVAQLMTAAFQVTVRRELDRALEARLKSRSRRA